MRVGLLTSGGDCQALNPTMRGVILTLKNLAKKVEIIGFANGYKGLIYNHYSIVSPSAFVNILNQGGTILGTSREPFKHITEPDENGVDKVKAMVENYKKLGLDCLVVLGGNGSIKTANLLSEKGLNVIALPKTIDNDIYGTDITFGFDSAISVGTNVIDNIRTTAQSHKRTFIVELMGHKVGWLGLYSAIAGGADIVLIPEKPFSIKKIADVINNNKKGYTIIVASEGAMTKEMTKMPKKDRKKLLSKNNNSIATYIASELEKLGIVEVRTTIAGHTQRGGEPTPYDRILSTRFGAKGAELIISKNYGNLVVFKDNEISYIPLSETAGKLKAIDDNSPIIKECENLGISFCD